ncbi:flagellin [Sporomusaceae bacterium BoRhaA]|uniref:flagellin N-terminal helical domain-containing protein n=1 Tax=Pelorhabdus rhamnosifermentans TaxID=2772457 RepID=UPI001C0614A0|nr:flagellin [Pelorhabdus rhamnosifermentans]MBU2703565.1 flagellin [Pelorhabdus rhamnosifermentans]
MIINHNLASLNTLNSLSKNEKATQSSLAKLSSGLRINSAADDSAGLAISEKMRGQIRGLDQAKSNSQNGISLVQTAEGALNETTSILQRMRELAVQSSSDTSTNSDRAACEKEVKQLKSEIDRISTTTQFNTKNLLDGSLSAGSSVALGTKLDSVEMKTAATQGTSVGGSSVTLPVTLAGSNNQLKLNVDGGGSQEITIAAGTYTSASDLASAVNTAIGNNTALAGKVTAEVASNGELSFVSASTGKNSTVAVMAGTNDATATLGMTTKTEAVGIDAKTTVSGGDHGTATGTVDISGGANIATGVNDQLTITLDGASSGTQVTIAQKNYTSANDLVGAVNDAINASTLKGKVTAEVDSTGKNLVFKSAATGTASKVSVTDGTNSAFTTLISATATHGATETGTTALGASTAITSANNTLNIAVDGGAGVNVTIANSTGYSQTDLVKAINTAIDGSTLKGKVTASLDRTNHVVFTSAATGKNSNLDITGTAATAVFGGTPPTKADGAAMVHGTSTGGTNLVASAPNIATGTNDTITVSVDGGAGVDITLANGTNTGASVLSQVQSAISGGSLNGKVTAALDSNNQLVFTTVGSARNVAVTGNAVTGANGIGAQTAVTGSLATSGTFTGSATPTSATAGDKLTIGVDGGTAKTITLGADANIAAVISDITAKIAADSDLAGKVTVANDGSGHLKFTSTSNGASSSVSVKGTGASALVGGPTQGDAVAASGTSTGSVVLGGSTTITAGTDDKVNIAVDGAAGVDVTVAAGTYTQDQLKEAVNTAINANSALKGKVTASLDGDNRLVFTSATTGSKSSVVVTATTGNAGFTKMIAATGTNNTANEVAGQGAKTNGGTGSTDTLVSLADADGNSYGVKAGNQINVSVLVGGQQKTATLAVTSTTTLQDLADKIQSAIGGSSSVAIKDNKIQITGQAGIANAVSDLTMTVQNSATDATKIAANFGSDLSAYSETQAATDIQSDGSLTFQIGANQNQTMNVAINKMNVQSLALSSVDVSTQAGAESAITIIDNATQAVSAERAKLGAYENRLDHTINNLTTTSENMTSAESRIRDVDMAAEMANYQKNTVLQQAAQAMLAQANQQPSQVLSLLK